MFGSDPKEYNIKTELTTCCFGLGTVYLAQHNNSRAYVSLKRFKMDKAKEECNQICVSSQKFEIGNIQFIHQI